MDKAIETFGLK